MCRVHDCDPPHRSVLLRAAECRSRPQSNTDYYRSAAICVSGVRVSLLLYSNNHTAPRQRRRGRAGEPISGDTTVRWESWNQAGWIFRGCHARAVGKSNTGPTGKTLITQLSLPLSQATYSRRPRRARVGMITLIPNENNKKDDPCLILPTVLRKLNDCHQFNFLRPLTMRAREPAGFWERWGTKSDDDEQTRGYPIP